MSICDNENVTISTRYLCAAMASFGSGPFIPAQPTLWPLSRPPDSLPPRPTLPTMTKRAGNKQRLRMQLGFTIMRKLRLLQRADLTIEATPRVRRCMHASMHVKYVKYTSPHETLPPLAAAEQITDQMLTALRLNRVREQHSRPLLECASAGQRTSEQNGSPVSSICSQGLQKKLSRIQRSLKMDLKSRGRRAVHHTNLAQQLQAAGFGFKIISMFDSRTGLGILAVADFDAAIWDCSLVDSTACARL